MGGACSTYGERIVAYRVLVGKPEGKKPLGRPKRRWEDNIKWIFKKWDVGSWAGLICVGIGTRSGLLWMR
jgi:hypothetical protein